jgi:omega-6 fatty acid desaturase (delta-12 desaturase)
VSSDTDLTACRRALLDRHCALSDRAGWLQSMVTILPLAAIWGAIWVCTSLSGGATATWAVALTALMSLFLLRVFVLMHECGHDSLFHSASLNRAFGFAFGVLAGMPQPVWSRNHQYHHSTNGNWDRYRGPLNVIQVDEYRRLSAPDQRRYCWLRSVWLAPLGGFLYLIVSPRLNWIRASVQLMRLIARHLVRRLGQPRAAPTRTEAPDSVAALLAGFKTPYCASLQDYLHMLGNNVALLSLWVAMAWAIGPLLFFACYFGAVSLAGAGAIVLFSVQHNFEHAYASMEKNWNRDQGVMEGTSFLQLPPWLNWFTANIAFHHIHHLCARVPNYRLAECHRQHQHLFTTVHRLRLAQIPTSLRFILWDSHAQRLISVAEMRAIPAYRDAVGAS